MTEDEFTVLSIAARGESLAPIGRWRVAVLHLAELDLMRRMDDSNYLITTEGRAAWLNREKEDDEVYRTMLQGGRQITAAASQFRAYAEKAAQQLAEVAQHSSQVTGRGPKDEAREWSNTVLTRALEILA